MGGILADRFDDASALGPVDGQAFLAKPGGGYRHQGLARMALRMMRLLVQINLTGRWRRNPFLDDTGQPIGPPTILTREERAALTKSAG